MKAFLAFLFTFILFHHSIIAEPFMENKSLEKALFTGGCFWCIEVAFDHIPGVVETTSGYTGGDLENPTYEQVASKTTNHFEAVQVTYDPSKVSYQKLLDNFWLNIDPTDAGGQFADRGTPYLTAIFYLNDEQKALAEASKKNIAQKLNQKIATQVFPAKPFYPAEDYHQDYYRKNPVRYNLYKIGSGRPSKLKSIWKNNDESTDR